MASLAGAPHSLTFLLAHPIPKNRTPSNSMTARGQITWKGAQTTKKLRMRSTKVQKTFQAMLAEGVGVGGEAMLAEGVGVVAMLAEGGDWGSWLRS